MSAILKFNVYHVLAPGCRDDPNWIDNKYGDGASKCTDMMLHWCENLGEYSTEAKMFCPLSCDACSGRFYYVHLIFGIHRFYIYSIVAYSNVGDME